MESFDTSNVAFPKSTIFDQHVLNEKLIREYQIAIEGKNIIKER